MSRETSKIYLFQYLALNVKNFVAGAQLQKVQAFRSPDNHWVYVLDFYPSPRQFVIALSYPEALKIEKSALAAVGLKAGDNPSQLYIRAHLGSKRIQGAFFQEQSGQLEIRFDDESVLALKASGEALEIQVPGRKLFSQRLRLADLSGAAAPVSEKGTSAAIEVKEASQIKYEKLHRKVREDLDGAQEFLDAHQEILSLLTLSPREWGVASALNEKSMALVHLAISKEKIPRYATATLGIAQDYFFQQRRRMQRKILKARERLLEIEKENPYLKGGAKALKVQKKPAAIKADDRKKHPGLKLTLDDDLIIYVGRSASENGELFRKMKDRDVWFHVRAEKGAHVWIPRGQKAFPKKEAIPQKLIELGAQIALLNSRADKSGSATVDYTERRHLKSTPGEEGLLRIERSETIFVRKDEALEKRLFAGR